MLLTIISALIIISILIVVHELGHFLAAKRVGIKVEEFGLGYPPRLWGKKVGETLYSVNWIPFGGFVRLFGQDKIDPKKKKGAFWAKSKRARFLVISSGVGANLILAYFLFSVIYLIVGIPTQTNRVVIEGVVDNSPAAQAGLLPADVVLELEEQVVTDIDDFIARIEAEKGETVDLVIERNGARKDFKIVPRQEVPEDQGPLGVVISSYELLRFPWWQMLPRSLYEGAKETYGWLVMIATSLYQMLRDLIFGGQVPTDIAGPLGIFQVTSHVARSGIVAIMQFMAILSVNLAIINIFPFPALDGGHFAFLIYEAITGHRSHEKVERWIHAAGMTLILLLMLLITINDVKRILTTTQVGKQLRSFWPF